MQVAESSNTDHSYISKTENNKTRLNEVSAELISKKLNINLLLFDLESGGQKDLEQWTKALFNNDKTELLKYQDPSIAKHLPCLEKIRQVYIDIIDNERLNADDTINAINYHIDQSTPYMRQMILLSSSIVSFNQYQYSDTITNLASLRDNLEGDDLLNLMHNAYLGVAHMYLEKVQTGMELMNYSEMMLTKNHSNYYKVFLDLYKKLFQQRESKTHYVDRINALSIDYIPSTLVNLYVYLKLNQTTDPKRSLQLLSQLNLAYEDSFKYEAITLGLKNIETKRDYYEDIIESSIYIASTQAKNDLVISKNMRKNKYAKPYNRYSFKLACDFQDIPKARLVTQLQMKDCINNKRYKEAIGVKKRFQKFIDKIT